MDPIFRSDFWIRFLDPISGSYFWIRFLDPIFGFDFWIQFLDPNSGSDFGSSFGPNFGFDNLISLSYSVAAFNVNLFGLLLMNLVFDCFF